MVKKLFTGLRGFWLALGVVLMVLLCMEGASGLFLYVKEGVLRSVDPRAEADVYAGAQWTEDFYRTALKMGGVRWHPYVYWRRKAFESEYINVDKYGVRKTWNREASAGEKGEPFKIFMFGGSAMWGTGARDDHTIPSYLSKMLSETIERRVEVVNYGEMGYVNTQEVAMLLYQLRRGNVPDMVIFYDNINDIGAAAQNREAGLTNSEFNRAREFNLLNEVRQQDLYLEAVRSAAKNSPTMRLMKKVLRKIGLLKKEPPQAGSDGKISDKLADDIIKVYESNIKMVEALGKEYGFESLFYWQPIVLDKPHLTPFEKKQAREWMYFKDFYFQMHGRVDGSGFLSSDPRFRDLSGIFANAKKPYFIDFCHLGEAGNEIVAENMYEDVLPIIKKRGEQ